MLRMLCRWIPALLVAYLLDIPAVMAQHHGDPEAIVCREREAGNPDLFANYWVPPGCGQVGASLYVAPQPVPPWVGHTYITYQPLMPHELLYKHHHSYYRYYDGGRGMTRARVAYYNPPLRTGLKGVAQHFRIPR
jgi:hypothetical protein